MLVFALLQWRGGERGHGSAATARMSGGGPEAGATRRHRCHTASISRSSPSRGPPWRWRRRWWRPARPILSSPSGFDEVIITFVVVVLGGIGSVAGSYVAGIGLGVFTALFGGFVSPAYTTAASFVVLTAVLRPGGLAAGRATR